MKGRLVILGDYNGRECAALVENGVMEDLVLSPKHDAPQPGAIYRAKVERPLKGQGGLIVNLPTENGFLRGAKGLSTGDMLLVQVVSVAERAKAVPVSDRILFKGRNVIVTPMAPGLNISRSIRNEDERVRLHDAANRVVNPGNHGVIIRSSAVNSDDDAVCEELSHLLDVCEAVLTDDGNQPELLLDGASPFDLATREWIVAGETAIEHGKQALEDFGILDFLDGGAGQPVSLGASATIFVEQTRALTAVDVNTGNDTSQGAGVKANVAAARALPRALRTHGLGGQIVIDFAPMPKANRRQIEQTLRAAFKADPIETSLVGWTTLGNFEIQRKRERFPVF